jgi:hypothetical protein
MTGDWWISSCEASLVDMEEARVRSGLGLFPGGVVSFEPPRVTVFDHGGTSLEKYSEALPGALGIMLSGEFQYENPKG